VKFRIVLLVVSMLSISLIGIGGISVIDSTVHAGQTMYELSFGSMNENTDMTELGASFETYHPNAVRLVSSEGENGSGALMISDESGDMPAELVVQFHYAEQDVSLCSEQWIDITCKTTGGTLMLYGTHITPNVHHHGPQVLYGDAKVLAVQADSARTGTELTPLADGDKPLFMPYNRWYRITMKVDLVKRTYDVYVDGRVVGTDLILQPSTADKIGTVQALYHHQGGTAYIGRVTVTTYNPL
jgi:hypothetical protein